VSKSTLRYRLEQRVTPDGQLVSPKGNGSPLHTDQRLLGIPDSQSRVTGSDPDIALVTG